MGRWTGDGEEMGKKREEIVGWRRGFLDVLERKERRDGKGWKRREREGEGGRGIEDGDQEGFGDLRLAWVEDGGRRGVIFNLM